MVETNSECSVQVTQTLSTRDQWLLHDVLLDRIELECTAEDQSNADPPPVEVFQAFETIDTGGTCFTIAQIEVMRSVLVEYHDSTSWWDLEHSRLENLVEQFEELLDEHREAVPTD